MIETIVAINANNVAVTIDTNVSLAICFSIRFWLSTFPINIDAKPKRIVKIKEKIVVNNSANSHSTANENLRVKIHASSSGNPKKHKKSQIEYFPVFAF